jgi:hypothetical protein
MNAVRQEVRDRFIGISVLRNVGGMDFAAFFKVFAVTAMWLVARAIGLHIAASCEIARVTLAVGVTLAM